MLILFKVRIMFRNFQLINMKGLKLLFLWGLLSIVLGKIFMLDFGNNSFIYQYYLNYNSIIKQDVLFTSIICFFYILSPVFVYLVFKKCIIAHKSSRDERIILGIFLLCGIYLSSPFVNFSSSQKAISFLRGLIIQFDWIGAIIVAYSFLMFLLVILLFLIKNTFFYKS